MINVWYSNLYISKYWITNCSKTEMNKCHLGFCVMSLNVHVWWVTWSDLEMHSVPSRGAVQGDSFHTVICGCLTSHCTTRARADCVRALPQDRLLWARQWNHEGGETPFSQTLPLLCSLSVTLAHCNLGYSCMKAYKSIYKPPWTQKTLQCVSKKKSEVVSCLVSCEWQIAQVWLQCTFHS